MLKLHTDTHIASFMPEESSLRSGKISDRYRAFLFKAKKHGMAEVEQLVPYYNVPPMPPLCEAWAAKQGSDSSAQSLLKKFGPTGWGYHMALSPNLGTLGEISNLSANNLLSKRRADYRLNLIFSGLEAFLGGGLDGRSLLDIACNWGGFSIEARLRGAGEVVGIDIRDVNVQKARALSEHFNLQDVAFQCQDIFDLDTSVQYDIVLNLGLMYHISQPLEMMRKTFEATRDIAVIDTATHKEAFSGFILGTGEAAVEHASTAVGMELHPTYRALIDLAYIVGFKEVVELHGIPSPDWPNFQNEPYGNKTRRCIICRK